MKYVAVNRPTVKGCSWPVSDLWLEGADWSVGGSFPVVADHPFLPVTELMNEGTMGLYVGRSRPEVLSDV